MARARQLLALRSRGLGDFLDVVPAVRALRTAFPTHRMSVAVPRSLGPLVPLAVEGACAIDATSLSTLPAMRADVAVNLHGRGPVSHRALLGTRPRRLIAFANAGVPASWNGPPWDPEAGEAARWCALLEAYGLEADPDDASIEPPDVGVPRGVTVVHPGAGDGSQPWPPERWGAVAEALAAEGHEVLITGAFADIPVALRVAETAGLTASCVFAGQTTLLELAGLVAHAQLVLSHDDAVGRLASAYRTPSVALHNPAIEVEGVLDLVFGRPAA